MSQPDPPEHPESWSAEDEAVDRKTLHAYVRFCQVYEREGGVIPEAIARVMVNEAMDATGKNRRKNFRTWTTLVSTLARMMQSDRHLELKAAAAGDPLPDEDFGPLIEEPEEAEDAGADDEP